ncbi:MAG: polysaccharide pyruvyl transferase family protein [Candidatus Aureabacteria bacterium]|nr:polysaccharide pyruvyl transferase family protein [Candidatus Auribacterota bacterium]
MKTICVLGNFSGRNAGDAAILDGLLADVSSLYTDLRFIVPTINPSFVAKNFSRYNVKPVSLMPWNLSLKIFGLPILTSTLGADLILVTDAILFDRRLFDPTHNYLLTLSMVLPLARKRGVPLVLYNMSVGPVRRPLGVRCLTRVLRCADMVITRDAESIDLAGRLGVPDAKLRQGAERPTVGFNINSYLDVDVRSGKGVDRAAVLDAMAAVINRTVRELDVDILLVVTQPMDMEITSALMKSITPPRRARCVSNRDYSHNELAAILGRLEIFTGMRTHGLILATTMGTPVAGIVSYPKTRGYLKSIDMGDQLIEFSDFSEETLWQLVERTWRTRAGLKQRLAPAIAREKAKARQIAELLAPLLGGVY